MGLFSKMFGSEPQFPELGPDTEAAGRLEAIRGNLEELAKDISDPLEVIPGDGGAYVFIGKPPKKFGIAWIEGDEVKSFKSMMAEHNVTVQTLNRVSDELREAYQRHQEEARFRTTVADRAIVVTPSEPLEQEVRQILASMH
ncbi:hypothetical protein JCM30471_18710 [Desulfuromonas carbonis]|uniref:hypothetical protein n=1 Tax=Desulfuromonas sp. DDH964 TaxID=1823759 RepID=UPI00078BC728|nr:hypothetical protein [Desulfuromonas sp. DDH964]AMV73455.1 hypothetical protein DBW_3148 [Desulfuromonas sp. DDH964]